jgi:hypothetical protein
MAGELGHWEKTLINTPETNENLARRIATDTLHKKLTRGKRGRGEEGKRGRGEEGKRGRGEEGKRARGEEGKSARR